MKTSYILPLVITLMSILFCSCEITEPLYSPPFVVTETTLIQIGNDSTMRCPIIKLNDTSLYPAMDDIIAHNRYLKHSLKGEKTWFQISFDKTKDTLIINLSANQYFLYSDFNERHTLGILYYKDELFAVNNSSELPEQFLTLTNDTITINKLYQGATVYYYEKGENNWPEYALVKYKYIHLQLEKIYAIINDEIITGK